MAKDADDKRGGFLHYLPYSEEDEKLGMVCTTTGNIKIAPNTIYPPRKIEHPVIFRKVAEGRILPEFQILYITEGEGVFTTGDTTYTVTPGSMLLLLPGIKHRYKPVYEIGWHEYWVGFNGAYFQRLLQQNILSKENVFFEIGLHDYILTIFDRIFDEVTAQRPLFQFKACVEVFSLISEMLTHERRQKQPNNYQKIVDKAKCIMESNIYNVINLPHIADEIGISTSRLNEIFKTYTSMTPYQYFIHIKILKAESLLEQEDASIKEISFRLGFEDQQYFSRLFRKKTGITPSRWKKFIYQ
jgi:AraC-like DNA-binding protein